MSVHNSIVLSIDPRGRFVEGIVSGTPKPGTIMEVKPSTEPVAGRHTYRAYQPGTDGLRPIGGIAILLENYWLGRDATTAYVDGEQCRLYYPNPGDDVKVLVANIAGTSDAFAIGDLLIVDTGTGKLIATTGSPECEPFTVMETVAALTADTLVWCRYTGY